MRVLEEVEVRLDNLRGKFRTLWEMFADMRTDTEHVPRLVAAKL